MILHDNEIPGIHYFQPRIKQYDNNIWVVFTFFKTILNLTSQTLELIFSTLKEDLSRPDTRIAHKIYKNIQRDINASD